MTDLIKDEIARTAIEYRARWGWRPVLVHSAAGGCCSCDDGPKCESAGKHPRFDGWHLLDASDAEIADWFNQYPGSNVGVVLGSCSGIVDFETDDEAGEQWLLELFDGNLPVVPTFQSRKGKHRLFQFRADLPEKGHRGISQGTGKDRVRIADLKLGNGRHRVTGNPLGTQSVFPPSLHTSGCRYTWLVTPDEAAPAKLPDSVVAKIIAHCTPKIPQVHGHNGNALVSASQAMERCRKYVAKMPPAISGQGGHDRTFNVACEIFRFGLSESDASAVLAEFNQRCVPSWGEWDLQHKLEDALDEVLSTGEFGMRLSAERATRLVMGAPTPDDDRQLAAGAVSVSTVGATQVVASRSLLVNPENRTDVENGRRFVREHGEVVRYVSTWGKWLVWDGRRWKLDDACAVESLAKATSDKVWEEVLAEVAKAGDAKTAMALLTWGKYTASTNGIAHMLSCARSEPEVVISHHDLDRDGWLLNLPVGTIDLRSGQLRKHYKGDLITKVCPIEYNADADCPRWRRFVGEIMGGDTDLEGFLRRLAGYWLTGNVREHVLPIFYGVGANGKSVFLNTLLGMLGPDYGMTAPADLLIAKKQQTHPTELADLFGKRLVCSIEIESGRFLAESLVKSLTGGDNVRARRMKEDFWEFTPTHKLVIAANYKPGVKGQDNGIWRRLAMVPFNVKFWDESKGETGPEELKQDKELSAALLRELPGILNWCLVGCMDWQAEGLATPKSVIEATDEYRADSDNIAAFVADCCTINGSLTVGATPLLKAYVNWCQGNSEYAANRSQFKRWLTQQGYQEDRFSFGPSKGKAMWRGLGLRASEESEAAASYPHNARAHTF